MSIQCNTLETPETYAHKITPIPDHSIPMSEDLLRKYGVADQHEIEAVDTFIRNAHFYGNKALSQGLSNLFKGMANAVDIYTNMREEILSLHKGILDLQKEALEAKDLAANAELVALQKLEDQSLVVNANYDTALHEIARIESLVQDKDSIIKQYESERRHMIPRMIELEEGNNAMREKLQAAQAEMQILEARGSALEERLTTALAELNDGQSKHRQLTSLPGAPFYDHTTQSAMECPVLQSNGYIVPLKTVISQWFSTVAPDDGTVHRTYICPLTRNPTTLASFATQDRIREIAYHSGIDITLPLVFNYLSENGQVVEFSFRDQLSITAKLCTIQTMQMSECVERIIVQNNTAALEINATVVSDGGIAVRCIAENLVTHIKYEVKASLTRSTEDGWDPLGYHFMCFE